MTSALTLCHRIRTERIRYQASPVTAPAPCKQCHPQAQHRSDWVSGVATFRRLTHLRCRSRFTCVV